MFPSLSALLLAVAATAPSDSAARDTTAAPRIVREFPPVTVVGGRFADAGSIETVQPLGGEAIRRLPVDRFVEAVGLKAGVVAIGEALHVRGGRAGELNVSVLGLPLNEPRRGTPMELPLFAVRAADLLTGGLDADHAGSLAGELDVQTEVPTARPAALVRWTSDGRRGTGFDAVHARVTGPLGRGGLGFATAAEVRLDDLGLPATRSRGRTKLLGRSFGWRQDNRLLAWARLSPVERPQRASLEVLASRTLLQPYNPMFDFDGWVTFAVPPANPADPPLPLGTADHPVNGSYFRYRAGDHAVMTEERRLAVLGSWLGGPPSSPLRLTAGWQGASALTSVGLRRERDYVNDANRLIFGPYDYAYADPFHAYFGDESYFRDAGSSRWLARADGGARVGRRHRLRFGAGAHYDFVRMTELDDAAPEYAGADTLRTYRAWAPGVFAYAQHRWEYGGLVWNAGLRVSSFTAGPQAKPPWVPIFMRTHEPYRAPTVWSWSPRLGFSYPVSDRDAFSLAYSRSAQEPPRDLLYDNRERWYDRHPLGNAQMKPAQVISWQAALKHVFDPQWSFQLGVFYRDVWGQPGARTFAALRNVYRVRYEDADNAHASGFELSLLRDRPGRQRLELAYTWMNAWGTQSSLEGLAFGPTLGARPDPTGQHALDWDQRHALAVTAHFRLRGGFDVSWHTRAASGLPWTPLYRLPTDSMDWPPPYAEQAYLNSRRLPWSENTNFAVRWTPGLFPRVAVLLSASNLFDNATDRLATLSGFPNPRIGTWYDHYGAFRTETGLGGGAYWNDTDGDGVREWVRVHDPRLAPAPRALRLGVEVAL